MTARVNDAPGGFATIEGFPYDPSAPVLLIRTRKCRLRFDMRLPTAGPGLRSALRAATTERLAFEPPERVRADFLSITAFIRFSAAAAGGMVTTLNLYDYCVYTTAKAATRRQLVNALAYSLRRNAPLLGAAMASSLREELPYIRPIRRKPRPGMAQAPRDGCAALSREEYADLARDLGSKLAAGKITSEDFALAVLATTLVPRPAQIAMLKASDLITDGGDSPRYTLRIVRIKQRGRAAESSHRYRPLDPGLGSLFAAQRDRAVLRAVAAGIDAGEAALFARDASTFFEPNGFPELPGFVGHPTSNDIRRRLLALGIVSRRSRRTLGTMMRADNRSLVQISLVLDNTPQAARIYVEDTPEMVARVEAKMGAFLAPLAALFLGRPEGGLPDLKPRGSRS